MHYYPPPQASVHKHTLMEKTIGDMLATYVGSVVNAIAGCGKYWDQIFFR